LHQRYSTIHCLQLHFIWERFLNIKNLKILLFNIYCAFTLCYNNGYLKFADIIFYVGTGGVIPKLIWVHGHAVSASAFIWLTRCPVCIVPGCPIRPYPGALYTAVHHLYTQHRVKWWNLTSERSKKTLYGGGWVIMKRFWGRKVCRRIYRSCSGHHTV